MEDEDKISPHARALAAHLKVDGGEDLQPEDPPYGEGEAFACEGATYWVLDVDEVDSAVDQYFENYIEDVVLDEIPEEYRSYFDASSYKEDLVQEHGHGPFLSTYDGHEYEEIVDGKWYFIYRVA